MSVYAVTLMHMSSSRSVGSSFSGALTTNDYEWFAKMLAESSHSFIMILAHDQLERWSSLCAQYGFNKYIIKQSKQEIWNPNYLPPEYKPRLTLIILEGQGTSED